MNEQNSSLDATEITARVLKGNAFLGHLRVGKKYNLLTITEILPEKVNDKFYCLCRCDCGTVKRISLETVTSGKTKSCGCAKKGVNSTHRRSKDKLYSVWQNMKRRCLDPSNKRWNRYGGRGIKVCPQWLNSFETFANDMGECQSEMSIDRINNEGDYEPSNCRWATRKQQARNKFHYLLVDGVKMTLREAAKLLLVSEPFFYKRFVSHGYQFTKNGHTIISLKYHPDAVNNSLTQSPSGAASAC